METNSIEILEKTPVTPTLAKAQENSSCCGGAPVNNEEACCKLDEEKKAEGESGCGCNAGSSKQKNSGCC